MRNANPNQSSEADAASPSTPAFTEGQTLAGCYVLRRQLSDVSAGSVWLARDEVLGQDVALFFIPAAARADEAAMESLRQHVKRARQSVHPNILRVYDLIEDPEWAALTTDTFEGESLAALRDAKAAGVFETADVKPWLAQLFQAMQDAHKVHLVHGDLSLANLFLVAGGKLLIGNFGFSRAIKEATARKDAGSANSFTDNASPEQLGGQASTAADDVYATGVLLHEALAGASPFSGVNRDAVPVTMLEHRSQLGKAGGPIPPGWEKVVAACLEKSPENRPKHFGEIAARMGLDKVDSLAGEVVAIPANMEKRPVVLAAVDRASAKDETKPEPIENTATWSEDNALEESPLEQRRSGFPLTGWATAALLVAVCLYALFFRNKVEKSSEDGSLAAETTTERTELTPVTNRFPEPARNEQPAIRPVLASPVSDLSSTVPAATPTPLAPPVSQPAMVLAANAKAKPTPAPPATPPASAKPERSNTNAVTSAAISADPAVAEKVAAFEAVRKAAETTDKTYQDLVQQREQADAALAAAKKGLVEKTQAAGPALKSVEEIAALRQQREADLRTAETAAAEAQKVAAEKVRLADQAKKAVAQAEADSKSKTAAQQKMEAELADLKKTITEREKATADLAKRLETAQTRKAEQLAALKVSEQEVTQVKAAAQKAADEAARKAAEMELARKAQDEKRAMIQKEMEDARRMFEERMKSLEAALKTPDAVPPPAPAPAPSATPKPEPTAKPISAPPVDPVKTEPPKVEAAPTKAPMPVASNDAPQLPAADSTLLAKADLPPSPVLPRVETNRPETKPPTPAPVAPANATFTNSLGMKFVPVGDLSFCIWQTRLKDFETFANATGLKSNLWRDPGFKQGPDHPVVNISWMEAIAFCKWLTFKEQREGVLQANQSYRLPTDVEWSKAVGLQDESGKTPEARDMGVPDVYPWGTQWPPPSGAGNYTGEETGSDVAIKGYDDGYAWTSPVGSFAANAFGIYDMGGNVWQWVMDAWSTDPKAKVLRGASWYNGALKLSLLSSCRVHAAQDSSTDNYGFRCVLAAESGRSARR